MRSMIFSPEIIPPVSMSMMSGIHLRGHALDVISWSALQVQTRFGGILGIIQHCRHRGISSLFRCTRGLHRVCQQSIAHVSRAGVHFETGPNRFGPRAVAFHQVNKAVGYFLVLAAVDEFLLEATQLWKFGKNSSATKRGQKVGSMTDSRIRGKTGKTVR